MPTVMRFYISGRVQGVFFRASTRHEAQRLGVKGWAINLPDGRVEVLAAGSATAVAELAVWLHKGPAGAVVEAVTSEPASPVEVADLEGFRCG